jgi:hypothetical protein
MKHPVNVKIRRKARVISLFIGALAVGSLSNVPLCHALTQPNPSTLHDYSINTIVTDLSPPTPIFKIKILSSADKLMAGGS